jgi:hypothetical protein
MVAAKLLFGLAHALLVLVRALLVHQFEHSIFGLQMMLAS